MTEHRGAGWSTDWAAGGGVAEAATTSIGGWRDVEALRRKCAAAEERARRAEERARRAEERQRQAEARAIDLQFQKIHATLDRGYLRLCLGNALVLLFFAYGALLIGVLNR